MSGEQAMTQENKPEEWDELANPEHVEGTKDHKLWGTAVAAIREIYDPEIPVNIYELGLIYRIDMTDREDGKTDVAVQMTLTSPACPVAQDMPGWVQGALFPLEGVENVDVEIVWDPTWDPSKMAETAKLQLNMFV